MASRMHRCMDALSAACNALLLDGMPSESISGRAWRCGWRRTVRVLNAVCFWNNNHCRGAHASDTASARWLIDRSRHD